MRCRIPVDCCRAPSAVCAREMPSLALRVATPRPLIWLVSRLEICRPAASSFALLMRKPVDRRWREVSRPLDEAPRLRWVFRDATLVLTVRAMVFPPDDLLNRLSELASSGRHAQTPREFAFDLFIGACLESFRVFRRFFLLFVISKQKQSTSCHPTQNAIFSTASGLTRGERFARCPPLKHEAANRYRRLRVFLNGAQDQLGDQASRQATRLFPSSIQSLSTFARSSS